MVIPYNDLSKQHAAISSEIETAIQSVLSSNLFIGKEGNPVVQNFENAFSEYTGAKHCIGCANGTDAIELALRAFGIGHRDEVIVPAQTWISTAEAVNLVGAKPVFADIDPETFAIDPALLPTLANERTKAIIPVHLFGLPADMDPILKFAREHSLKVIEDSAQAHGALYKGKQVGTLGDIGTFSFFPGKNLGGIGDAGGLTTNNDELALKLKELRDHGRAPGFDHSCIGRNSRLDGIQAAVLELKLKHLPDWTKERQLLGARYRSALEKLGVGFQKNPTDRTHVYHVFCIQTDKRDSLREELSGKGVRTGIHYPVALPFTTSYRNLGYGSLDFPVAQSQMKHSLSIPLFPTMTEAQQDYVIQSIAESI